MSLPCGDPALELGPEHYDRAFKTSPKYLAPWFKNPARHVTWYPALALVQPPILDVGCGPGQFAEMCEAFGYQYTAGLDTSSGAIEAARLRCPGLRFQVHDARESLPVGGHETVTMLEVLEHVYRDREMLAHVPRGMLVVASVPSFQTVGHCRWFGSETEVMDRYGELLDIDVLLTEQAVGSNRWFVFRGVRR